MQNETDDKSKALKNAILLNYYQPDLILMISGAMLMIVLRYHDWLKRALGMNPMNCLFTDIGNG